MKCEHPKHFSILRRWLDQHPPFDAKLSLSPFAIMKLSLAGLFHDEGIVNTVTVLKSSVCIVKHKCSLGDCRGGNRPLQEIPKGPGQTGNVW